MARPDRQGSLPRGTGIATPTSMYSEVPTMLPSYAIRIAR
jgi:hypothetical protein